MKQIESAGVVTLVVLFCGLLGQTQQIAADGQSNNAAVPMIVNFSSTLTNVEGQPSSGTIGVTFCLYKEPQGGAPLWMETQNIHVDKAGRYKVGLGSTSGQGLPAALFASGEARWLGVQAQGQEEQPRVLLVSVPYALKALDAETLGGKPASAFMVASSGNNTGASQAALSGSGKKNFIPLWLSSTKLGDSKLFQNPVGSIGIGTTTPAANLDVNGTSAIRNTLTLFSKGSSPTLSVSGTAFSVSSTGLMHFVSGQTFPGTGTITGVSTASGSGLAGGGTSGTLSLSLLKTCTTNQVLQWNGSSWACATTGTGTITGVNAGTDMTGGGTSGNVTLNLDTSKVPQLNAANAFTGNQSITGNLNDSGNITATGSISGQIATFSGNNSSQIMNVTQSGSGSAISATSTSGTAITGNGGVAGDSAAPTGIGVGGFESGTGGLGVFGWETSATGATWGVEGLSASTNGTGVLGLSSNTNGTTLGVNGISFSLSGAGVLGQAPSNSLSGTGSSFVRALLTPGVWGDTTTNRSGNTYGAGVFASTDDNYGMVAANNSIGFTTILAENLSANPGSAAFVAELPNLTGTAAIIGDPGCGPSYLGLQLGSGGMFECSNYTLLGDDSGGNTYLNAGDISGDPAFISFRIYNNEGMRVNSDTSVNIGTLNVTNSLTKPAGSFKIDHPLDPANKYLFHSFVESPDMKNIYDGVATLDDNGEAVVILPDWFQALNRDFRYQLTTIGGFAPVYIAEEVLNNRFKIAGGKAGIKVSWQVTGTRQDAFANAHRIEVEVEKAPPDRGHYLHPDLFGAPETDRIGYVAPMSRDAQPKHSREEMMPLHNSLPGLRRNAQPTATTARTITPIPTPSVNLTPAPLVPKSSQK